MAKKSQAPAHPAGGTKENPLKPWKQHGLSPGQYEFCLQYLAHPWNQTRAYIAAFPDVKSRAGARASASYLLTLPNVRDFLRPRLEAHWKGLQMTGDEVLALVAQDARADVRLLHGEGGKLLPLNEWPDELASSVEAVEFEDGRVKKVKLASKTSARRTILEVTGKVKAPAGVDELAEALRATIEQNVKAAKG